MKRIAARDAKNGFGLLIDAARESPVAIEKFGRPVVVVLSVEAYERLIGRPLDPVNPVDVLEERAR